MAALDFRLTGLAAGKTLHGQLRAGRHKRSMSLRDAAVKTGLSQTTIVSLERGGGSVASLLRLLAVIAVVDSEARHTCELCCGLRCLVGHALALAAFRASRTSWANPAALARALSIEALGVPARPARVWTCNGFAPVA